MVEILPKFSDKRNHVFADLCAMAQPRLRSWRAPAGPRLVRGADGGLAGVAQSMRAGSGEAPQGRGASGGHNMTLDFIALSVWATQFFIWCRRNEIARRPDRKKLYGSVRMISR
jgi:hypothetical protein